MRAHTAQSLQRLSESPRLRRPGSVLLLLLLGLCTNAPALAGEQLAGEQMPKAGSVATGRHFRVTCYFQSEKMAAAALKIAEAVWGPAVGVVGQPPAADTLMDIHLYRTPAAYRKVEQTITRGKFARNNAFCSWDTRAAYIAIEPAYSDALLEKRGLSVQTRRSLAHEAAHLVAYRAWPNYRRQPKWLSEGLAIWAADHALVPGATVAALAARPYSARRIVRLRTMAKQARLPKIQDLLRGQMGDLGFYDSYACWWGFFRLLNTGASRVAFRKILAAIPDLPTGGAFRGELLTRMLQAFGGRDGRFGALDTRLRTWALAQPAEWDEQRRSLSVRGHTWWQLGFPEMNALCWRTHPPGKSAYRITGRFEIEGSEDTKRPQMNVLLARAPDEGFVSVSFTAGFGVTLWRYFVKGNRWEEVAFKKVPAIRTAVPIQFDVQVVGNEVTVTLAGQHAISAKFPGVDFQKPWGVGCQAGSAGAWYGVKLR